jgi:hypothetical protein
MPAKNLPGKFPERNSEKEFSKEIPEVNFAKKFRVENSYPKFINKK